MTARAIPTDTLDDDTVREAIEHINANMREADRAEIAATIGDEDPVWALFDSWDASIKSWLILDRSGLPIGIFGVAMSAALKIGSVWLIGTDGIETEGLTVARQTRQFVKEMNEIFPALWANVDVRNEASMRWLEWAGFSIADADPAFGPEKRLFLQYLRTR